MWEEFMTPGEVDNRIKVYEINEKGERELVRVDKFNPFEHEMEDDEMAKPQLDINWEPVIKRGHELVDEGLSLVQAAKTIRDEMNLDCSVASIYNRIIRIRQQAPTQDKVDPAQATNQEPEQGSQEPATEIIADDNKGTDVSGPMPKYGCPFDDPNTFNPDPPVIESEDVVPYAVHGIEPSTQVYMNINGERVKILEQYVTPQNGIPKLSPQAFIKSRQMRAEMLIEGLLKDALALQLVKEMVERGII